MKYISVSNLVLRNFKGIAHFEYSFDGENVDIFGGNGAGKTTVFDAVMWTLFDKDSKDKKDFAIKTIVDGETVRDTEHSVSLTLVVDGVPINFFKKYHEVYTKKSGSLNKEFTGHTTEYFINDVPKSKKEYTQTIAEIADERLFKLLTSPYQFSAMKWQDRREQLFKLVGEVSDDAIIGSNSALADLPKFLEGRTVEELRKIVTAKRSKINRAIQDIPVRIDELKRRNETLVIDATVTSERVAELEKVIAEKENELRNIKWKTTGSSKAIRIMGLRQSIEALRSEIEAEARNEIEKCRVSLGERKSNLDIIKKQLWSANEIFKTSQQNLDAIETAMQRVRETWATERSVTFESTYTIIDTCTTCLQEIPKERQETAKQNALGEFNVKMSQRKEELTKQGQGLREQQQRILNERERMLKDIEGLTIKQQEAQREFEKATDALQRATLSVNDLDYSDVLTLEGELADALQEQEDSGAVDTTRLESEINEMFLELKPLQLQMQNIKMVEADQKRVAELEAEKDGLIEQYDILENQLYLTEQFTRIKCNYLEDKINALFTVAKFKLFEVQVNGGVNDVCDITDENGIPFDRGLNTAAQVKVGLDIINTLSKHYKIIAPVIIDNAESVNELPKFENQIIRLIVSALKKDQKLRAEKVVN